jgi:drug/metabolite transporter (DMT)-like permease
MVEARRSFAAWAIVLNAGVWGLSWLPFRLLQAQGLHPLWATALIYALCLACLLLWQQLHRSKALRHVLHQPWLWWLMVSSGLTNTSFNWAVTYGDVLRVVLLFYLMPAWSVLLAWALLGERPTAPALLRLVLALGGVLIVLKSPDSAWQPASFLPRDLYDALAVLAGFCFALTSTLIRKLGQHEIPRTTIVSAMFGGGALFSALAAWAVLNEAPPLLAPAWLVLALGTGFAFLAANLAFQYGAARLSVVVTSLLMLMEVVFSSTSAVALGAAQLQAHVLIGGALIGLAALWAAWAEK